MSGNALKQERHRLRMKDAGLVQCNIWVPEAALAAFKEAAEKIRADHDLTIGPLVSATTGRMVGRHGKPGAKCKI